MIYTVLSLFAFYSLSTGSRRLLQAVPQFVPIQPVQPIQPIQPIEPGQPAPIEPGQPAQPAVPINPVVPQPQPQPRVTLPPFITLPPLPAIAPMELECVSPYTSPGSCSGQIKTITNAHEGFKWSCGALGACAGSQMTFEYLPGNFAERIEGFWFSEAFAAYGATVTIRNLQGGNTINLDKVECQGDTSCQGLTIILENASINELDCAYSSYCPNCFVKNGPLDPHPTPCYGW